MVSSLGLTFHQPEARCASRSRNELMNNPSVGMLQTRTMNQSSPVGMRRRNPYTRSIGPLGLPSSPEGLWVELKSLLVVGDTVVISGLPLHAADVVDHHGEHSDEDQDRERCALASVLEAEGLLEHLIGEHLRAELPVGGDLDDVVDLHHSDDQRGDDDADGGA